MADISPARLDLAKQTIRRLYARTGGMPSVLAFAKEMGYSSTASAFEVTEALVVEGFLAKGPTGRLLPGRSFEPLTIQVPDEMLAILPARVDTRTLRVRDDSMSGDGILSGDYLVVMPAEHAEKGAYVLSKGRRLAVADGTPTFASRLEISPSMWSQIKSSRPIGDKLARQIEQHAHKPPETGSCIADGKDEMLRRHPARFTRKFVLSSPGVTLS